MIAPAGISTPCTATTGTSGPGARTADVVVVGGGPAGASTAQRLARAGFAVTLLDARAFPRSKPCGDAVSPGAIPLLDELGVWARIAPETGSSRALGGWRIRSPGGRWIEGRFDPRVPGSPALGIGIDRAVLDAALVEAAVDAGVRLVERRRVFDLLRADGRVSGVLARGPDGREERWSGRFIVGADGLRSRVARRLGRVGCGRRPRLALVRRYEGAPDPAGTSRAEAVGELRISREGVLGWAPTGDGGANLTLVVPLSLAAEISGRETAFFEERVARYDAGARAGGWPARRIEVTGPFETVPSRRSAPGALLVGDSSGYFDPFTGQGVFRALHAGRLAAAAIGAALRRPETEPEMLRAYEAALDRSLAASRRLQRWIDVVVDRSWLMNPASLALSRCPSMLSALVDATGDRIEPGALLRRGVSRRVWS